MVHNNDVIICFIVHNHNVIYGSQLHNHNVIYGSQSYLWFTIILTIMMHMVHRTLRNYDSVLRFSTDVRLTALKLSRDVMFTDLKQSSIAKLVHNLQGPCFQTGLPMSGNQVERMRWTEAGIVAKMAGNRRPWERSIMTIASPQNKPGGRMKGD